MFQFFSIYANKFEKKCSNTLSRIALYKKNRSIEKIVSLMQENIAILNLWIERNYKGYKYLNKSIRKTKYNNLNKIRDYFLEFIDEINYEEFQFKSYLKNFGYSLPVPDKIEKLFYLYLIGEFLSKRLSVKYKESVNFGEILNDPDEDDLIADCNQLVTIYIFLYSLRYEIKDLNLRLIPGHVLLHFEGFDIETTSFSFESIYKYKKEKIYPIYEIIAVNILDIHDKDKSTFNILPKTFLASTKIAEILSSDTEITMHNLSVALKNIAISEYDKSNYDTAIKFALNSKDESFSDSILMNIISDNLKKYDFFKAKKYASKYKLNTLISKIEYQEAIYNFNQRKYESALKLFQNIGDDRMTKNCYIQMANNEIKKISDIKDVEKLRSKRNIIKKISLYADKSNNPDLIKTAKYLRGVLN